MAGTVSSSTRSCAARWPRATSARTTPTFSFAAPDVTQLAHDTQVLELRERKELSVGNNAAYSVLKRPPVPDDPPRKPLGPIDLLWSAAASRIASKPGRYSPYGQRPFVIKIGQASGVLPNSAAANKLFGIGVRCGAGILTAIGVLIYIAQDCTWATTISAAKS